MDPTTVDGIDAEMILATLQRIEARQIRLEEIISRYEPLLTEAAKRMAGPMRWGKGR